MQLLINHIGTKNMKTLTVIIKSNYGNEAIYPDCNESKLFAKLANTRTLTPEAIRTIKALGYNFKINNSITL